MPRAHSPERDFDTAQRTFHTVAVTVGGLYFATHSVTVTIIGTTAASLLAGWALHLERRRGLSSANGETPRPADSLACADASRRSVV